MRERIVFLPDPFASAHLIAAKLYLPSRTRENAISLLHKEALFMSTTVSDAKPAAVQMAPAETASTSEMDETEFLLSNPENARRLRQSIAQIRAGQVITVDPKELGIDA